jgi:hypothetical protein
MLLAKSDPNGLLRGQGKTARYLELHPVADFDRAEIAALMAEAVTHEADSIRTRRERGSSKRRIRARAARRKPCAPCLHASTASAPKQEDMRRQIYSLVTGFDLQFGIAAICLKGHPPPSAAMRALSAAGAPGSVERVPPRDHRQPSPAPQQIRKLALSAEHRARFCRAYPDPDCQVPEFEILRVGSTTQTCIGWFLRTTNRPRPLKDRRSPL